MRHRMLIVLAALALGVTACAEDEPEASMATVGPIASESIGLEESDEPSPTESAEASFEASFEASESPEESFGTDESESPDASASPTEDDGIGGDDDGLTASCEDAFDAVPDLSRIDSLQQLEDVLDGLEQTIESCESVDAWTEAAQEQLSLANIDIDARQFLERQCEDEDLADAPLCEDL